MNEDNKIYRYLDVIERSLNLIREELGKGCVCNRVESHVIAWLCPIHGQINRNEQGQTVSRPQKQQVMKEPILDLDVTAATTVKEETINPEARKKHISDLMAIDCWPEAVLPSNVSHTPEFQVKRAKAILDLLIDTPKEGFTFLDFGCGGGWTTAQMYLRGPSTCIGYDIIESEHWKNNSDAVVCPKLTLTTDFELVKKHEYDVIFLYDVLDHCHDPIDIMSSLKPLLKPDGKIYVRCHPFFAKHGTHLYEAGLNKSFIHLFLKPNEIIELGYEPPYFTRFEPNPIESYRWWFNDFKIEKEKPRRSEIHEFFLTPSFKELLAQENNLDNAGLSMFFDNMQTDFIDYILVHNND